MNISRTCKHTLQENDTNKHYENAKLYMYVNMCVCLFTNLQRRILLNVHACVSVIIMYVFKNLRKHTLLPFQISQKMNYFLVEKNLPTKICD